MVKINCTEPLTRVSNVLLREGLYPKEKLDNLQLVKIVLHCGFYALMISCVIINAIKAISTGNAIALNQATCIFLPIFNLGIKAIAILKQRKYFLSLIDDLRSDVFNSHSEKLNEYVKFVHRTTELILRCYTIVVIFYVLSTSILPFITSAKMMIPAPFDMKQYDVVYNILHMFFGAYLALNSASFDVLFMSLLGLCIAQLYILEQRLRNIYEESRKKCEDQDATVVTLREAAVIKQCVLLYLKISQFSEKLCTLLSLPMIVQYAFGGFIICNTILQLTMSEITIDGAIGLLTYSMVVFSEMAVYHWLGNEILYKVDNLLQAYYSENIINACYLSRWYKLNTKNQKLLITLMERAKRPLVIQLYKLVFLSLQSLGVVIRWSYSLFALIKARYT